MNDPIRFSKWTTGPLSKQKQIALEDLGDRQWLQQRIMQAFKLNECCDSNTWMSLSLKTRVECRCDSKQISPCERKLCTPKCAQCGEATFAQVCALKWISHERTTLLIAADGN